MKEVNDTFHHSLFLTKNKFHPVLRSSTLYLTISQIAEDDVTWTAAENGIRACRAYSKNSIWPQRVHFMKKGHFS